MLFQHNSICLSTWKRRLTLFGITTPESKSIQSYPSCLIEKWWNMDEHGSLQDLLFVGELFCYFSTLNWCTSFWDAYTQLAKASSKRLGAVMSLWFTQIASVQVQAGPFFHWVIPIPPRGYRNSEGCKRRRRESDQCSCQMIPNWTRQERKLDFKIWSWNLHKRVSLY